MQVHVNTRIRVVVHSALDVTTLTRAFVCSCTTFAVDASGITFTLYRHSDFVWYLTSYE